MDMFELFAILLIMVAALPLLALCLIGTGKSVFYPLTLISKYQQKHIKNNPMPEEMKRALDMAYHKGFEEGIDKNKRDVAAAFEAKSRAILTQHLEKMKNFKEGLEKDKKKKAKRGRK